MLPICCTLSKGSVQQEKSSNCSKSFASQHQTRRRSGYPIHATAQVALAAPFSQSSSRQMALVQPPVAQAVDTLAVAVAGKRAALVQPAPQLAAAGDRQSVRSAEHPSGFAVPISWPHDGPLHKQRRRPRLFGQLPGQLLVFVTWWFSFYSAAFTSARFCLAASAASSASNICTTAGATSPPSRGMPPAFMIASFKPRAQVCSISRRAAELLLGR